MQRDKNRLRVAITADSELLRRYLSRLLIGHGIDVVTMVPLTAGDLGTLPVDSFDVLLVEIDEQLEHMDEALYKILEQWPYPLLLNDSLSTRASLSQPDRLDYGRELSRKLHSLVPQPPQSVA